MDKITINTYNKIAEDYDEETKDFWLNFPNTLITSFVEKVSGDKKVLDMGSGPGRDALILQEKGLRVVCFDASKTMLELCKNKGLETVQGCMLSLPFEDKLFDAVWAYTSLLHLRKKDIDIAMNEINRVLKKNGIFSLGMIEGEKELYRESSGAGLARWFAFYKEKEYMNKKEKQIEERAIEYARSNKKNIAKKLTSIEQFVPDEIPVAVFMAGSPGAGKTESAKNLIMRFSKDKNILHIDTDDLRAEFDDYNGTNSSLFQGATSIIADKMQDFALSQEQSYIFDGTLTNLERTKENINRNLKRKRKVFIVYVYQNPIQAWKFVKAREKRDGRNIPKDDFIDKYFKARENVNFLKKEYADRIQVDIVVKNIDGTDFKYRENIDIVDNYITEKYSKEELNKLIIE